MIKTHTAQQLYVFAMRSPGVQSALRKSFATLAKHMDSGSFETDKALSLLAYNVRDAARFYVQHNGETLAWAVVFPQHEREGCAALFLRQFDGWYAEHRRERVKPKYVPYTERHGQE